MTAAPARLVIGLADIARLAHVQRPVVSAWRSRSSQTDTPFPEPVRLDASRARFDGDEVVTWLEVTGHGLNPDARADLAAFARPEGKGPGAGSGDDWAVGDTNAMAAATLLCLKAVVGESLTDLDADELVDLADDADPDDGFLYREVVAMGPRAVDIASYVDRLADAAYTPAQAFERLVADQYGIRVHGNIGTAIRAEGRRVVAHVARALAVGVGLEPHVFVDPTPGGSDLLLEIASLYAEGPAPTVMTSDAPGDLERSVRRRLRVHDVPWEPLTIEEDGAFTIERPAVLVAQLPLLSKPTMTDKEILTTIDNIVVQMDDRQWAAIIGPGSALTDQVSPGEGVRIRDGMMRSDRVRAMLRLPKGLVVSSPRQPLALWVLGPSHPDVPVAERWTVIGNMSNATLDGADLDAVVTDVVAAMGNQELVRSHAFRFGRRVVTSSLLASRTALVGSVIRPERPVTVDPAAIALRAADLVNELGLTGAAPPATSFALTPRSGIETTSPTVALGTLLDSKALRLVKGHLMGAADMDSVAGARVIGRAELTGQSAMGARRVDHRDLGTKYPAAHLTLPGDVIFCTSPRVAAYLDHEGGSLVLTPARALRVVPGVAQTVVPEALLADIHALPPMAKSHRLWAVRVAPSDQTRPLSTALATIEHERAAARARLAKLDELATLLVNGTTARAVVIDSPQLPTTPQPPTTPQEGR